MLVLNYAAFEGATNMHQFWVTVGKSGAYSRNMIQQAFWSKAESI